MVRHVYRDLLKVVRRHAKGDHFAGFVSQEFRKNTVLKDPIDVRHKLDLAKDYSFLVRSVHAHKELLISYNIGVDRGVEQSARLKNTAERVGLSMPKLFESDELPK